MHQKLLLLKNILKNYDGAVIAYSGGVDSTFLVKVAHEVLGDELLAITACSEIYPEAETQKALELIGQLGVRHLTIQTKELNNAQFVANPPDRCYHCKANLFSELQSIAARQGFQYVLCGDNYDDQYDHRPGMIAAQELGVKSPLVEAGLTKDDIRQLSRQIGLPTWNKPALACQASRFPYGEFITKKKLNMVGRAEAYLHSLGIGQLRVRHHDNLARLEVSASDMFKVVEAAEEITRKLKEIGYAYVTLDLLGYRTGSLNEVLENQD